MSLFNMYKFSTFTSLFNNGQSLSQFYVYKDTCITESDPKKIENKNLKSYMQNSIYKLVLHVLVDTCTYSVHSYFQ